MPVELGDDALVIAPRCEVLARAKSCDDAFDFGLQFFYHGVVDVVPMVMGDEQVVYFG